MSDYLAAIQNILNQNQSQQQTQLRKQETQQNELLTLQKGQVKKAEQIQNDTKMMNAETSSQSYIQLLKQLMSLSARNASLNDRMFS